MSRVFTAPLGRRTFLRGLAAAGAGLAATRTALASESIPALATFEPVRFAVIGDWGCARDGQYAVAERMAKVHAETPFGLVMSVGDNIYPSGDPEDFGEKFERPYEPLLKQKVPFYTSFGNHDVRNGRDAQLQYPLFNMNRRPYYTVVRGNGLLELFVLDSTHLDDRQLAWLDRSLGASRAVWKLAIVHHPPYSSGKAHGSDMDVRRKCEPLFVKYGVQAVFSGDDHIYQRVTPQQGVQYFVTGSSGKLRGGDIKRDDLVAFGYDTDNQFMVVEVDAAKLDFRSINPRGEVVDSGTIAAPVDAVARFLGRFRAAHA